MDFVHTQKFVRMSPRKLRFVADMVRKLDPNEAVEVLPQIGKRAGEPLSKVIKTAIANAKVKGVSDDTLEIKEIQIGDGPRLKRGRPVSRGRWHPYIRRMSHIRVVLTTKPEAQVEKLASGRRSSKQTRDAVGKKTRKATTDRLRSAARKRNSKSKIKKTVVRRQKVKSKK